MLGFLAGIGLAFLIELLNDLVRTPRDVDRFLHIPLLGIIPDLQEDVQTEKIEACHVVRQAPYSMISESYRRFRTNLKLTTSAKDTKVVLVSSSMAGEGKTSMAVNLACSLIAEGRKVLLIDANFWRPNINKIFPNPNANSQMEHEEDFVNQSEFGLSTLLAGLCGYQEVIRPSGIDNLSIIDTGLLPSNPAELLGGAQMEQLLKHQRANYDYIIIDGPPVLLVSDVKTLARLVDGTVLVFNANTTRRGVAIRAIRELNEVKAQILGCALVAVRALKGGYFTEQLKSHQKYQKLQLAQSV
jgi:polysaccharide biosynthesis transport protein